MKKMMIEIIGDGKIGNIDPDPKPYGSDLTWSVVIGEEVKLNRGDRIVIYRNSVGHLSLTIVTE